MDSVRFVFIFLPGEEGRRGMGRGEYIHWLV